MPIQTKLDLFFFSSFGWTEVIFSTYSVCRINERIIDSYDVDVIVLNGISEDNTSDTTEAINTDLYWCHGSK
jgi:hypothetical protein